ncbi:MAG: hypothetical protein RSG96_04010, partial [Clostridia bacterium]
MKRLVITLLLCCFLVNAAFAQASAEPLRVLDGWVDREYQIRYPQRALETIRLTWEENLKNNLWEILASGQWDVALVSTNQISLSRLHEAGLLMDLGTIPALAEKYENMFPSLLNAVTQGEKRIALPAGMLSAKSMKMKMVDVVQLKGQTMPIRENLGFTAADEPTTFAQLCALAERYMALPKATRKNTVFDIDSAIGNAKTYFLYYFIDLYTAQMVDQNGQINYHTPLFRQSMEQLENMARLLAKDRKINHQQGSKGVSICGLLADAGCHFIGNGNHIKIKENDTRIIGRMDVMIINANTTHLAEALDYCSLQLDYFSAEAVPLMYEVYNRNALVQLFREQKLAIAIESNLQEEIELAKADMRLTDDSDYYYTEEEILAYRKNVAPNLVFPAIPSMDAY